MIDIQHDFVHLVRLALDGKNNDLIALARRNLKVILSQRPDLSDAIQAVIKNMSFQPARSVNALPLPVDQDSRLELLRREEMPVLVREPVWPESIRRELLQVIKERKEESKLYEAGLEPTKSLLFVGPPGVGKTLAAKWISLQIKKPLLILDLAAVMSSFLGRTGNNIRAVLDYAKQMPSVLLLDEFDSVAKRRDDSSDVGELKRLVTVLLQAVDDWPASNLLIAATNHPELLDPAVWRRFDRVIQFPLPSEIDIQSFLDTIFDDQSDDISKQKQVLAYLFSGLSFADISREANSAKREAVLNGTNQDSLIINLICHLSKNATFEKKVDIASILHLKGLTQREISSTTGLSRDTIRKYRKTK